MPKPKDAAGMMARLLHEPESQLRHIARLLREADRDLWPAVGSGKRNGGTKSRHLNALLIAALAPGDASPIEAPQVVAHYRGLKLVPGSLGAGPGDTKEGAELVGMLRSAVDFGEFQDALTDRIQLKTPGHASFFGMLVGRRATIVLEKTPRVPRRVLFMLDGAVAARFEAPQRDILAEVGYPGGAPGTLGVRWNYDPWDLHVRQTRLPWGVFLMLASILHATDPAMLPSTDITSIEEMLAAEGDATPGEESTDPAPTEPVQSAARSHDPEAVIPARDNGTPQQFRPYGVGVRVRKQGVSERASPLSQPDGASRHVHFPFR
jgi:hypothetical protein